MNLYLKYRPQTFKEVIGQDPVVSIIENSIAKGNSPHAYLLTGTRGTGKTTIGRLIAKALNCEHQGCGKCNVCFFIQEGIFPDLIEIDAASNRGIDNIRTLKEQVSYSPQYKTKVYIIDECHMLTKEASNALLKVLEEPPAGVVFVLCTTEEDKILQTIKSRCQVHSLSLVSIDNLKKNLLHIAEQEGILLEEQVAEFMAQMAKGSVRDSISIMDKFRDLTELSIDKIKEQLGQADQSYLVEFLRQLASQDIGRLLLLINTLSQAGINLENFILEVEEFLQNINYKLSGFDNTMYQFYNDVEQLSSFFSQKLIIQCFDSLSKWRVRFLPFSKLNLEVAVTEVCLFKTQQTPQIVEDKTYKESNLPMDWMTIKKETPKPQPQIKDDDDDF